MNQQELDAIRKKIKHTHMYDWVRLERKEAEALLTEIDRLQAERDAAVEDLRRFPGQWPCHVCKYEDRPTLIDGEIDETLPCTLMNRDCFEWRGLEGRG